MAGRSAKSSATVLSSEDAVKFVRYTGKLLILRIRETQWERAVHLGFYYSETHAVYVEKRGFSDVDGTDDAEQPRSASKPIAEATGIGNDVVDSNQEIEAESETTFDLGCLWWLMPIISSVLYLMDVATDAYVAYTYYSHSTTFFTLAVSFILLCAVVNTIFGIVLYVDEFKRQKAEGVAPNRCFLALNITLCVLQLDTVMRYCRTLYYSVRVQRSRKINEKYHNYVQSLYEDNDTSMLRLVETNLESAPQLLIQLYFLLTHNTISTFPDFTSILQLTSIFFSFTSYAFSLVMYSRSLRLARRDKCKLGWGSAAVMFLWQLFMIMSRMLALAIFAATCTWMLGVLCAAHFAIMFTWILIQRTDYCGRGSAKEVAFNFTCALMHVFGFLNLKEGRSRGRYLLFYTLFVIEAVAMCLLAAFASTGRLSHLSSAFVAVALIEARIVPLCAAVFGALALGVTFQVLYYVALHPTGRVRVCVPLKDWRLCGSDFAASVTESATARPNQSAQPQSRVDLRHTSVTFRPEGNGQESEKINFL